MANRKNKKKKMKRENKAKKNRINRCDVTDEKLSGRGGLALFSRYLNNIGILSLLGNLFGSLRKNENGFDITEIFRQVLLFFFDNTSPHLVQFDDLKKDEGYAAVIETDREGLISSHVFKRFFGMLFLPQRLLLRKVLRHLFIRRLKSNPPDVVILGADTMPMDNDDAKVREGVKPTYKRKKGFQPLHIYWKSFIIDAVFRAGDRHSNHGDDMQKVIGNLVGLIRDALGPDIPIVVVQDSGFFDKALFDFYESLGIGFIGGGNIYNDIRNFIRSIDESHWDSYKNGNVRWDFIEFGDRRGVWNSFLRAIYTCRPDDNGQLLLEGYRPDTIIYTNIGMGGIIDRRLREAGVTDIFAAKKIIEYYHGRGRDELVNRSVKDFYGEKLPFKRFYKNAAFYHTMLIAFFLFESFKIDVASDSVSPAAYPTTVRRRLIDIAAKVVRDSGQIVLRVTRAVCEGLGFKDMWRRSGCPPVSV